MKKLMRVLPNRAVNFRPVSILWAVAAEAENNRARRIRLFKPNLCPASLPNRQDLRLAAETKAQSNARNKEAAGLVVDYVISQSKGLVFKLVNARNKEASGPALSVTFHKFRRDILLGKHFAWQIMVILVAHVSNI